MLNQSRVLALGAAALLAVVLPSQACAEPNFGTSIGNGDDTVLPIQALGFAFPFHGMTYTDVHVSTNGLVYLSNAGVPAPGSAGCCAGTTADLVAGSPKIAPYWSDLVADGNGSVFFNALPGRVAITWSEVHEYQDANPFTVQMQLLATGEIFITYDSRCQIRTAGDFLVGASPGGGAILPAASDLSVSGATVDPTVFELWTTIGSFDLAGESLFLIPTSPGSAWVTQPCPKGFHTNYGTGCYAGGDSFYQLTTLPATSSAVLSNTAITLIPAGGEYAVVAAGTYVPPTGAATPLVLTDDSSVASPTLTTAFPYPGGSTTALQVCSNGSVWVAGGNSTFYAPTVDTMLNTNTVTGYYAWHDYNPGAAGSGQVKFEEVGSIVYVTWDGVYNYSGTSAADATQLQFQFDTATGQVVIAFGTVSPNLHTGFTTGQPHLVGYSSGGASFDYGPITFASDLPIVTQALGVLPMSLAAAPGPAIGSTVTYTASAIPEYAPASGVYLTTLFFSLNPLPGGFDLAPIGAAGCKAFIATLDVDFGAQVTFASVASWNVTLSAAGFAPGNVIAAQAVALVVPNSLPGGQNAFGMTVTNGVLSTIGSW